jgi:AcrR family transcriptional regulator
MGRPKNFTRDAVLEKALPVFWRRGFADASLHELELATGVNKSGLYAEFKDKEDLFMQSLQYYLESLEKKGLLTTEPWAGITSNDSSRWDHVAWTDKRDVLLSAPFVSLRYCRRKLLASSLEAETN